MINLSNIVLVTTATTTALIAGLFYAWTCSVTPGLARLSNLEYVRAMQSFNITIQNPLFFISFMGTALLLPLCSFMHFGQPVTTRFWFLLIATIFYLTGTFGVTVFGNIPLNEALANFKADLATPEMIADARMKFEKPWNSLNTIRTISATISIVMVILACIAQDD